MVEEYIVLAYSSYIRVLLHTLVVNQIRVNASHDFAYLRPHSPLAQEHNIFKVVIDQPFKHRDV